MDADTSKGLVWLNASHWKAKPLRGDLHRGVLDGGHKPGWLVTKQASALQPLQLHLGLKF